MNSPFIIDMRGKIYPCSMERHLRKLRIQAGLKKFEAIALGFLLSRK